jgi:hypothetical protein
MNEFWLSTLEFIGVAWWVEIVTESPACIYYFGPYANASEAEAEKIGFIADLEQEGARDLKVTIKRCKPEQLTIFEEGADSSPASGVSPAFSGQT